MALVLKNRVKVTSTTTGTGAFTLGSAVAGYQDFTVIGGTAPTAWNISLASYSGVRLNVQGQETIPTDVFFRSDGIKMYVLGTSGDDVNEYTLSTPWLVSSATFITNFSISSEETGPGGLFFKPDGTKMYITGSTGDDVNEYDLSTAWDINSASYLQSFSVAAQEGSPQSVSFKPDGTKMYILGNLGVEVNEYDLSTPWDVSSASYLQNFSVSAQETNPLGLFLKPDGTRMYVIGSTGDDVNEYDLSTPWDISTASYVQVFSVAAQEATPSGIFFRPNGLAFYVIGSTSDSIYQYTIPPGSDNETYYFITDGTDFEAGLGSVSYDGLSLSRDRVFASSNSNALVNWGAGDKDVVCGYPAEGTPGGIPFCDDSEIGTDLSGWQAFRTAIESGITGGQTYANNGVNGIVSTYSLVYTNISGAYRGGVLAPNGDIHFIPFAANRGLKVSIQGVQSTYSLVYTTTNAYCGGVLAANGDIHFIPFSGNRGQKISNAGVVSTYSLVYTTGNAYWGGVLAPNGDIHFIPWTARVGQKVSAAGTVSTYSLVYTTSDGAFNGGVLAPNGDIYFVPNTANRGQKISAAGVVSTYSLVYTVTSGYSGGVLTPDGDIYFVPQSATVGQKINTFTEVVSTYSLIYTTTNAYTGGVLAPNGDIHFIKRSANRGQKISSTGVVSTYSLINTGADTYIGGTINTNGEIYFIHADAQRGQKISTNPGKALGPGICLSSFLNKF
jgi:sugar lactone lactonase YvrE